MRWQCIFIPNWYHSLTLKSLRVLERSPVISSGMIFGTITREKIAIATSALV
ncbi:hypothetical protein [Calothrix sp. NIES-2100]|uniref:hypothetical protein n=1 Tax=Calothrix sp. NIES-2100 TaxID=1954172 RepID=UPI0030D94B45